MDANEDECAQHHVLLLRRLRTRTLETEEGGGCGEVGWLDDAEDDDAEDNDDGDGADNANIDVDVDVDVDGGDNPHPLIYPLTFCPFIDLFPMSLSHFNHIHPSKSTLILQTSHPLPASACTYTYAYTNNNQPKTDTQNQYPTNYLPTYLPK